jgi:hypothetical protein
VEAFLRFIELKKQEAQLKKELPTLEGEVTEELSVTLPK